MEQETLEPQTIADKLKAFIQENFLYGDPFVLNDQDSFLETGILDSTGVLQLVTFLEREFGIRVQDEELVPENLDSLSGILDFLARKQAK